MIGFTRFLSSRLSCARDSFHRDALTESAVASKRCPLSVTPRRGASPDPASSFGAISNDVEFPPEAVASVRRKRCKHDRAVEPLLWRLGSLRLERADNRVHARHSRGLAASWAPAGESFADAMASFVAPGTGKRSSADRRAGSDPVMSWLRLRVWKAEAKQPTVRLTRQAACGAWASWSRLDDPRPPCLSRAWVAVPAAKSRLSSGRFARRLYGVLERVAVE